MIEVRNLTKRFGSTVAVDRVGFDVPAGTVFGLLGPNGAGKTTTLRILATLIAADEGEATVAGHDVVREAEAVRRTIGVVNGGMGLYDRLTGRETLRWFGELYGMERAAIDARIDTLSSLLDLTETLDRRCGDFSTGMKQKIVIARAVIHDPPVLFFDEASSGLDVLARRALLDFARTYPTAQRSVIWSTHVMSEAEELCDRVGIVVGGRLIGEGTVTDLRERADEARDLEEAFFRLVRKAGLAAEVAA
ncbi:MAG: ATP-binding cassette domain-containing protein [Trueperaceae bacterium]